MGSSKVELFEAIRRDRRVDSLSIRALAERHGVHRRTVRQALDNADPLPRKTPVRRSARLESLKKLIDAMLQVDLDAPRKQRHTARRVLARLVDEHGVSDVSYSTVRDYVALRRPQIAAAAGRGLETAFVLQTHLPGAEAEVDFGDVWIRLAGVPTKCFLFTLRLSFSGKAVHRVFASQGQEAFIEGHLHAFAVLGGVPTGQIRYDNLRSAVSRVLMGRNRTESDRWVLFRSHYAFDAFYCIPGIDGAHEKGGVEGEVGRFRRNHLVPVPEVDSLSVLNARIDLADSGDDGRRIDGRLRSVGQDFAVEAPLLGSLPDEGFESGLLLTPRVDRFGRITVRQCHYSVPIRLIGSQVRVFLRASELVVFDGRVEVCGSAITQARRVTGLDRVGPSPPGRHVYRHPRGVLGCGPPCPRRRRRHPRPDRRAAVAPPHPGRRRDRRDQRRPVHRRQQCRRRRGGGPQGRRTRPRPPPPATHTTPVITRADSTDSDQPDPATHGRAARRHPTRAVGQPLRPAPAPPDTRTAPARP